MKPRVAVKPPTENGTSSVLIETETLKDWSSRVDELLQEVLDSDVNDQLKETIAQQLNAIRTAILYYRIYGTEGLRNAVWSCWGALLVHNEEVRNERSDGEATVAGTLDKVFSFLQALTGKIKVVKDVAAMLPGVKALLTGLGSGTDG